MPEVSVLISTFRPGGIDVSLAGMRDQTFRDFEVVLVDRRYELRHGRVRALAREYGIDLVHVPEHRRNDKWMSLAAGWNTAMAVARGEYIIFLQDYCYAPPGWIEAHLEGHRAHPGAYIVAPYRYLASPPLALLQEFDFTGQRDRGSRCTEPDQVLQGGVVDELYAYGEPFEPSCLELLEITPYPDQDTRVAITGQEVHFTWVHLKNESLRRQKALDVNGLDERLDRGKGPIDIDWGMRLHLSGASLVWRAEAMSWCLDPRSYIRTMPWGDVEERLEGRWSYQDGLSYNGRREAEVRAGGSPRALNPWDIETLAELLEPWRRPGAEFGSRDATDIDYWGREIWPETP